MFTRSSRRTLYPSVGAAAPPPSLLLAATSPCVVFFCGPLFLVLFCGILLEVGGGIKSISSSPSPCLAAGSVSLLYSQYIFRQTIGNLTRDLGAVSSKYACNRAVTMRPPCGTSLFIRLRSSVRTWW